MLILGLLLSIDAQAQEPLQLELSRRVPVTSAESMAMGSAGMAFATGAKGVFFNPASPAIRKVIECSSAGVQEVVATKLKDYEFMLLQDELTAPADKLRPKRLQKAEGGYRLCASRRRRKNNWM